MAITEEKVFKCEKCGNEFKDNIYLEVDVNLDGVIANGCVNGDIYKHTCPNCKEHILFLNPITYRDSKKLYIIQSGDEETLKEAKKKFKDDIKYDGYKLYGARTNTEMIERIHELEAGYDPIYCEVYKWFIGYNYENKRLDNPVLNYLNNVFIDIDVKGDLAIILETLKRDGRFDYDAVPFDRLAYEKYRSQFYERFKNVDAFTFDLFDVKNILNDKEE